MLIMKNLILLSLPDCVKRREDRNAISTFECGRQSIKCNNLNFFGKTNAIISKKSSIINRFCDVEWDVSNVRKLNAKKEFNDSCKKLKGRIVRTNFTETTSMQSFWLRNRAGISVLSCQIMLAFTKTRGSHAKFRVKNCF